MKCILVVDDEVLVANTLCEILRRDGFMAFGVTRARDAFAVVEALHPDLILLDVVLPDARGLEHAIRLRDQLKQHVVLMSGVAIAAEWLEEARQNGMADFKVLAKPMDPRELLSFIRTELGMDNDGKAAAAGMDRLRSMSRKGSPWGSAIGE